MVSAEALDRVLLCGVNWLGDAVMSMPALQCYRAAHPATTIELLTKPPLASLWAMHPAVDAVHMLDPGTAGVFSTARRLRAEQFGQAIVLPNSFRSAFVPWWARIPRRRGVPHRGRAGLINERVMLTLSAAQRHQAYEYVGCFGVTPVGELPTPVLRLPDAAELRAQSELGGDGTPWLALIPGAARGPSKQWPADRVVTVAQAASAALKGLRCVVLGTAGEAALCAQVAGEIGPSALNLAGMTSLVELAALLARCRVTLCNDSGGMHLSAAVGTPVVAIYGLTNPAVTGPLGTGHRVVAAEGVTASRQIARDSEAARQALASIPAARVSAALIELLTGVSA